MKTMNTTHSPEPWAVVPKGSFTDDSRLIASTERFDIISPSFWNDPSPEEEIANTYLIQAAPKLLSALKTVLNIAQVNMEGYTTTERNQIFEAESLLAPLTSPKNS